MDWKRLAEQRLGELALQFPAVVVLGARQVGKTTLAKSSFPTAAYKNIESTQLTPRVRSVSLDFTPDWLP